MLPVPILQGILSWLHILLMEASLAPPVLPVHILQRGHILAKPALLVPLLHQEATLARNELQERTTHPLE